jgi:cbb3-type cytochrome oxidase subunit 3
MSQKILKFIVIFLGILIVICFLALVYGLYIKTTKKQSNLETNLIEYNLNLEKGHKITDIDMIDNNRILFTIKSNDKVYALIYDIETSNITKIDTTNE